MSTGTDLMVLRPGSFDEVKKWAAEFAPSQLVPQDLRTKPGDVAIVLLSGAELGIPPMQSLRQLYVVKGRVTMAAEMMLARILSRPDVCLYFICVETTDSKATFETHRKGSPRPQLLTFTMQQATRAKLTSNPAWSAHPEAMLRARAIAALARITYPDIIGGLYAKEELEGTEDFTMGEVGQRQPASPIARTSPLRAVSAPVAPPPPAAESSATPEVVEAQLEPEPADSIFAGQPVQQAGQPAAADAVTEAEPLTMLQKLDAVRTVADLEAIMPALTALPPADKQALKSAYHAAKKRAGGGQ